MPLNVQHGEKSRMILIFQYLRFWAFAFVSSTFNFVFPVFAFLGICICFQHLQSFLCTVTKQQSFRHFQYIRQGPLKAVLQIIPSSKKNTHKEQGSQIYVIERSVWRAEHDVSDILQHFSQGLLK